MNILVLGTGAIGSVFGGFLAKSLHQVVLLGRASHMDAISRHGLKIEGIWGEHHITNLKGYSSLRVMREKEGEYFDLILLTVKSYDTEGIVREYLKIFPNAAPMVSLQNGLGNLEKITELVGRDKVVGGRVIFGAEIVAIGIVKVTVYADKVVLGGVTGGIPQEQVVKIAKVFSQSGIPSEATESIEKYIWGKILYNGALNALGSILEVQYGELLKRDSTKILMREIVK
jgi:2-dehydropantoate 2-reductase